VANRKRYTYIYWLLAAAISILPMLAFAAPPRTIGEVAIQITKSMQGISELLTSISVVSGMGFTIGAIMKFRQHKDNPTQIPAGTPIALLFVAAAFLYLPTVFTTVGNTIFGVGADKATISGYNVFIDSQMNGR
jgi:intracellular multiplication protein IcmD